MKIQNFKNLLLFFTEGNGLYWLIAILFVCLPFVPWAFTQFSYYHYLNFSDTGEIGDTIGGLTAPFIGLLNAALLFLTLKRQDENNRSARQDFEYDHDFELIRRGIKELSMNIQVDQSFPKELKVEGKQTGLGLLATIIVMFDSFENASSYTTLFPEWKAFVLEVQQILIIADKCTSQVKQSKLSLVEQRNRYQFISYQIAPIKSIYERAVKLNIEYPENKMLNNMYVPSIVEFDIFFDNIVASNPDLSHS